jgi:predicted phosphoribosyltransferase
MKMFRDRSEAGRRVAPKVARLDLAGDVVCSGRRAAAFRSPTRWPWYADFSQLDDEEIVSALERAAVRAPRDRRGAGNGPGRASTEPQSNFTGGASR